MAFSSSSKKGKNMIVVLEKEDLIKAVQEYLKPKMAYHEVEDVRIREVKIGNSKEIEVTAKLKEKDVK
jgi:hypothetical protein